MSSNPLALDYLNKEAESGYRCADRGYCSTLSRSVCLDAQLRWCEELARRDCSARDKISEIM